MALNRPILRLLLALALCLQSSLAMAHCLRLTGGDTPFHVTICTAEGLVQVDLGGGDAAPQGDAQHAVPPCPFCQAPAQFVLDDPPSLPLPRLVALAVEAPPALAAPPPPARAPPYRPTGPPALS
jgi:hypothetical protein